MKKKSEGPTSPKASSISPVLLAIFLVIILGGIALVISIAGGLAVYVGALQSPTTLSTNIKTGADGCAGTIDYIVDLKDANAEGLAGQKVTIFADGDEVEKLGTDQNGHLAATKEIPIEWCGKTVNFTINYGGDIFHKNVSESTIVTLKIPTKLQLSAPSQAVNNTETIVNCTLINLVDNNPIANKSIVVPNSVSIQTKTDAQGVAQIRVVFNETGIKKIKATFNGDDSYLSSESSLNDVLVVPETCSDGTIVGECSDKNQGQYCLKLPKNVSTTLEVSTALIPNCEVCACATGLVCYRDACIAEEQRTTQLIEELQDSIVYVEHSYATGSGVILSQSDGETIILTNKHVVEGASSIGDVEITTYGQKTTYAKNILVAPNEMDLAIIYVSGTYGTPAKINYSEQHSKGQAVIALGSPLGIQGSVSDGIISNFIYDIPSDVYSYDVIQTDAAINPGNSGGGLFLKSTGSLIGINTLVLPSEYGQEGLGFAIDIKELQALPSYSSWETFTPTPRCFDGTPYGSCSIFFIGKMCLGGYLEDKCEFCGCLSGQYCPSNGKCFSCPAGYTPYEDYGGEPFCCPPGTIGYVGGYCY